MDQARVVELYEGFAMPLPTDSEGLVATMCALPADVTGAGRFRLLAYLELQAEAARKPWLSQILDAIAVGDFARFEQAQRSAGLPVTGEKAALVTLTMHGAIPHLLVEEPRTLAAAGLVDLERFVRSSLAAVYGEAFPGVS
ncbi:hypothetical protein [Rhizohabitans arisaemae]|uniref:hypothetical protein n=1 Tax=Rhizohabitans arisaemae TaxID=2720610 RepID=UPI0024B17C94|nr:hypothetical protein [Rhizohabitans arisaemae]